MAIRRRGKGKGVGGATKSELAGVRLGRGQDGRARNGDDQAVVAEVEEGEGAMTRNLMRYRWGDDSGREREGALGRENRMRYIRSHLK